MTYVSNAVSFAHPETTGLILRRVSLSVACVLVLLLSGPLAAQEPTENEEAVLPVLELRLESSDILSDEHCYVRVRVKAANVESSGRPPLNLALVFDRSGSMKEDSKIGFVREAARLVVDNLTRQDHVALVAYNHQAQTLVPLHPAVNREYLYHRIDELYAQGYTNLSGGLLEGCAQLRKRLEEPGRHHVMLMTDGLANRGVIDADALVKLVERCTAGGITITTLGVGTEYDETLLGRMARAGGGRYVYVASAEEIPAALKEELGALLAAVAQNARFKIELPPNVDVVRVFGRDEPVVPGLLELPLGDLSSGEERVFLVEFALGRQSVEPVELRAVLTYDDVAQAQRVDSEQTITVARAAAGDGTTTSATGSVLAYARLVKALDKISHAVNGMDRRLASEVRRFHREQYPELKQAARASRDQDFVNKAFMFAHYARELEDLIERGALHEHSEARAQLRKELHYRRYLMEHHQHGEHHH